jgi:hypothetical protein
VPFVHVEKPYLRVPELLQNLDAAHAEYSFLAESIASIAAVKMTGEFLVSRVVLGKPRVK